MALSTTTNRVTYAGNDIVTAFSFPYYFLAEGDLTVIITTSAGVETVQTITTHYTVSGAGNTSGGTVTMVTAPATGETLTIYRDPAITQGLDLVENDALPAESVEESLDRLTMISQRNRELADRTVGLSDGFTATFDTSLPSDLDTANYFIQVNAAGDGFQMVAALSDGVTIPSGTGILVKDAATTAVLRSIIGESGVLTVTNGDGVSGNPTLTLDAGGVGTAKIADLAVTEPKLAQLIFNALTTVAPQKADSVPIADSSDSGNKKKATILSVLNKSQRTITASSDTPTTEDDTLLIDTTSNDVTVNLFAASGNAGKRLTFKLIDATNKLIIDGNSTETIDGATTYELRSENEAVTIESDGTNWVIVDVHLNEVVESKNGSFANWTITASQYGDVTSISLTPGTWDIEELLAFQNNGAVTAGIGIGGISTESGNSFTDLAYADNAMGVYNPGTSGWQNTSESKIRVTITSNTTYYLKGRYNATITNLRLAYRLTATRVH